MAESGFTMRFLQQLFLAIMLSCFMISCQQAKDKQEGKHEALAKADSSTEIPGIYMGMLPCADCSGIEYTLTLNPDSTFILKSIYLGKPTERNTFIEAGSWNVIPEGILQLELPQRNLFLKSKGKNLLWLDNQGGEIKTGQNYQLSRIGNFE
jgi:uncharacterized lipoprotein NlpE involved in copper resistance